MASSGVFQFGYSWPGCLVALMLLLSWQSHRVLVVHSFLHSDWSCIVGYKKNRGTIHHPFYAASQTSSVTQTVYPPDTTIPEDSEEELASIESWRSTSKNAKHATIVYSAPSSLDANATLQVKQRSDGWHTVGIVGGPTKSIYHGVFRKEKARIDPFALGPSEYIRTMASAVLTMSSKNNRRWRFLHMGYGSGSLPRLLKEILPNSYHESIDVDPVVADAAVALGLVDPSDPNEQLVTGDAIAYGLKEPRPEPFDGICIDVFDAENLMPSRFYSVCFLRRMRNDILCSTRKDINASSRFVVHNFHVGNKKLAVQLEDALVSYRTVFGEGNVYIVNSLNNNKGGGNTVLIAVLESEGDTCSMDLQQIALRANQEWKKARFDISSRMKHVRPA